LENALVDTMRRRLKAIAQIVRTEELRKREDNKPIMRSSDQSDGNRAKMIKRIAVRISRALDKAYADFGLNRNNRDDQFKLVMFLACAKYGVRRAGHPRVWTSKKLIRLRDAVRQIRSLEKKVTETEACRRLSKGKGANGRYKDMHSATLRRVLQRAKKIQKPRR